VTETWLTEAERLLWDEAGEPPFPRDIEAVAADALPVFFKRLPNLSTDLVEAWISQRHGMFQFLCPNRELRGCIVALRGKAVIFTDADDSPEERRLTQAHEVAHFLLDYKQPRERALTALGTVILPVLDGDRAPTSTERVHAMLSGVPLGAYHDFMERDDSGQILQAAVQAAESRADQLALHLMAPLAAVISRLPGTPLETERAAFGREAVALLCGTFGLPAWAARNYGRFLWTLLKRPASRQWLGL
jgi:hypothetical protein